MNNETYNGWTNYETWNWKLWMDNDGSDERWNEEIENLMDLFDDDRDEVVHALSGALEAEKDEWLEVSEIEVTGPFADILGVGLSRINWHEIAEHMVDDYD